MIYYSSTKGILRKGDLVVVSWRKWEKFSRVELLPPHQVISTTGTDCYFFRVKELKSPVERVLDLWTLNKQTSEFQLTMHYGESFHHNGQVYDHIIHNKYKRRKV